MDLQPYDERWLPELMGWFPDAPATLVWGGPSFRHPFTASSFQEDMRIGELASWVLLDGATLAGFGQYYRRAGRCHLGRLAIAPDLRGRGFGARLVRELCARGSRDLGLGEYSLFVMAGNDRASALYRRLGFSPDVCPEPLPHGYDMTYMVARQLA